MSALNLACTSSGSGNGLSIGDGGRDVGREAAPEAAADAMTATDTPASRSDANDAPNLTPTDGASITDAHAIVDLATDTASITDAHAIVDLATDTASITDAHAIVDLATDTASKPDAPSDVPPVDGAAVDADLSMPLAFCQTLVALRADYQRRCYGESHLSPDYATRPPCSAFAASVADGGVGFDPSKAPACLQAYQGLACPGAYDDGLPTCDAITPKRGVGATCDPLVLGNRYPIPAGECAGTAICHRTPGSCGGICTAPLAPGDGCFAPNEDLCPTGSTCANNHCTSLTTPGTLNQSCDPDVTFPCVKGLYCAQPSIKSDGGFTGTCQALKAPGDPCVEVGACAAPALCSFFETTPQCYVRKLAGAACTPGKSECQGWCGSDDKCSDALLAIGADCTPTPEYKPCVDGARCVGNVCTAFAKPGDPCTSDDECGTPVVAVCDALTHKCDSCE
jgi:hypothetical protein